LEFDIRAIGSDYPGITGEEVIRIAIEEEEKRTIVTYDSDYGELIFKYGYKPAAGVVYIRVQPTTPTDTARIIEKMAKDKNLIFNSTLTVVDAHGIRQKKY